MRFTLNRALAAAGLLAAAVAYYPVILWRPIRGQVEGPVVDFFFGPSSSSPQLVLGLWVILLWGRRQRVLAALGAPPKLLLGSLTLLSGVGLFCWSLFTESPDLEILSLIPLQLGAALLLGGGALLRAILLPACLLVFALPLPAIFVNQIIFPLQLWTAGIAKVWLDLLGMPVVTSGDLFLVGGRSFQVIESCSGLRSIATILMATVPYIEVFRVPRIRALLLLAAAPLIAFFFNSLRVLSIVLLADLDLMTEHTAQGILSLVFGMLTLHVLNNALIRVLPARRLTERPSRPVGPLDRSSTSFRLRSTVVVSLLIAIAASSFWIVPWKPELDRPRWGVRLPREWGAFESRILELDEQFLGSLRFQRTLTRAYEHDGERVELFLGYDDLLNRTRHPLSPKNAIPGTGWTITERRFMKIEGIPKPVVALLVRSGERMMLAYSWYEGDQSFYEEALRALLAVDRSPLRETRGITAIRLATRLGEGGRAAAERRLGGFARRLESMVIEAHERLDRDAG